MMFLRVFVIFILILFLITNFSGRAIAEEEFTPELKITIDQWGNITIQTISDKISNIFQTGIYNFSFHLSNDITNFSSILQIGQSNYSYVKQLKEANEAKINQQGNNNTAVIKQSTKNENKGEEE